MGRTLAADVSAPARPAVATALTDGWALAADLTLGAGGYAPALLAQPPTRVEAGQAMPPDTDSVAPFDAVKETAARRRGARHRQSGRGRAGGRRRLRARPAAAPRRRPAAPARSRRFRRRRSCARHRARAAPARVAAARLAPSSRPPPAWWRAISSGAAARCASTSPGAGSTSRWRPTMSMPSSPSAAPAPAATTPACTCWRAKAAWRCMGWRWRRARRRLLGFADARPVLLLPGRLDAALAVWLTVGRRMLARLAARQAPRAGRDARRFRARWRRPSGLPSWCRCGATATRPSRSPAAICRCRRSRAPMAGSWCRPRAKAMPPAARSRYGHGREACPMRSAA